MSALEWTRVYLPRGTVAHLLGSWSSPNHDYPACVRCGRSPRWPRAWLGTGSMAEQEHAAALRLCEPRGLFPSGVPGGAS